MKMEYNGKRKRTGPLCIPGFRPGMITISGTEGFGFMEDQAVNEAVRIILELPAEKQNELWDRLKSIGIIKE